MNSINTLLQKDWAPLWTFPKKVFKTRNQTTLKKFSICFFQRSTCFLASFNNNRITCNLRKKRKITAINKNVEPLIWVLFSSSRLDCIVSPEGYFPYPHHIIFDPRVYDKLNLSSERTHWRSVHFVDIILTHLLRDSELFLGHFSMIHY